MNYRLAVLTHGRGPIYGAIAAFYERVTPEPSDVVIYHDGGLPAYDRPQVLVLGPDNDFEFPVGSKLICGGPQVGFCEATGRLWRRASDEGADYVFWLEHDFVVSRSVDLEGLASVLDANLDVAQMALMRDAANDQELAVGGLFESRPGQYAKRRHFNLETGYRYKRSLAVGLCTPHWEAKWLEHRAYFTTNPSLMRRDFMADNSWPDVYESECEGRFGIDLVNEGWKFGVWGSGEPWCRHVGVRDGFGY